MKAVAERAVLGEFFTPDAEERVPGFLELQQTTVLDQLGDQGQVTEQQPISSFLLLLLFDL